MNLAARLETACAPEEILISYETYAHVKDQVHCEEHDEIRVKGVAHPVATYQVVDTHAKLGKVVRRIREDHPYLKLNLDLDAMSAKERTQTADILRGVLEQISDSE